MKNKIIVLVSITLLLVLGIGVYAYESKIDCSQTGVIFLTPAEARYTSDILKQNPNIIVSTPEIKRIVGDIEAQKQCKNFDIDNYISTQLKGGK